MACPFKRHLNVHQPRKQGNIPNITNYSKLYVRPRRYVHRRPPFSEKPSYKRVENTSDVFYKYPK